MLFYWQPQKLSLISQIHISRDLQPLAGLDLILGRALWTAASNWCRQKTAQQTHSESGAKKKRNTCGCGRAWAEALHVGLWLWLGMWSGHWPVQNPIGRMINDCKFISARRSLPGPVVLIKISLCVCVCLAWIRCLLLGLESWAVVDIFCVSCATGQTKR